MKENSHKSEAGNRPGKIKAISVSKEKGTRKNNVSEAILKEDFGIVGDAHSGMKNRQVSLLARESIDKMKAGGLDVGAGDFAENITTEGMNLTGLEIGSRLKAGKEALLEISQIGKVCHARCSIYYQAGDCVMPKEGVFVRVVKGGIVKPGDRIELEA